ncbi:phosphomannomutase [Hamiltosporidium tvaerminnensis]|uniref:Phosphomannomutase n=2 Tax=Hamiltosporidium TaxID=1176354 RepID=A0A4V2JXN3_9MICR|nr:Phosphomannomutase 1 [Hamiltosporidium tvaerminnensis]TBU02579.1 phosphomannomutase [Hamiltosporidium magnivora]TBU04069.1 phosphomannomutase [Hamiltosporidium tvaerminnensis]TBU12452.1 phosphomannomutase [Hamiltosporidium tvaerminnensis]TBU12907.1 phosphomannomutase [Hamiltosporidium tvaerminnensis]
MARDTKTCFLFDVDGTLTPSRQKITPEVLNMLKDIKSKVYIAFVGGSDINKQIEQVGDDCLKIFDFGFPENGVAFYEGTNLVEQTKIIDVLGEELYKKFVNYCLSYFSKIDIPIKRGTFIEYRNSMINLCPIGRSCSKEERKEFKKFDDVHLVRQKMVDALQKEFGKYNLQFSIGGEISIDCFPKGWDKTYCIQHLEKKNIKNIYFFGDMTHPGGNDYEIFVDKRVVGIKVEGPSDTVKKVYEKIKEVK